MPLRLRIDYLCCCLFISCTSGCKFSFLPEDSEAIDLKISGTEAKKIKFSPVLMDPNVTCKAHTFYALHFVELGTH